MKPLHSSSQSAFVMFAVSLLLPLTLAAGCGTGQKRNENYFTSGNREADQRAQQRMAKAEQLHGSGENAGDKGALSPEKKPLFARLGGDAGIKAIVDDFINRAIADPRVNWQRKGVKQGGFSIHRGRSEEWNATPENVKTLKDHMAQFLSLATGGPSVYQGHSMKDAHANMHISNDEFDAAVGDLKASLDKFQVPNQEQKELLAIIETTRGEIVQQR